MRYSIRYGVQETNIDITETCVNYLSTDGIIYIPPNDNIRAEMFTDPLFKTVKSIFIYDTKTYENPPIICDHTTYVIIDIIKEGVYVNMIPEYLKEVFPNDYAKDRLKDVQKTLKIKYGKFNEEIPEQLMSLRFLTGDEKVLEIGGNIGRNSLIIASILKKKNNQSMVTLESDAETALKLEENKNLNGFSFFVEPSALSKRKLIQGGRIGWETFESEEVLHGFKPVNTITLDELRAKYNIEFDTLVLDCEGAFYNILKDMPEVLDNIQKFFIENDFRDVSHKKYVDEQLEARGFQLVFSEDLDDSENGYWWLPCKKGFFQYWEKK